MNRVLIVAGVCISTLLSGCFFFEEPEAELVMPKGMVIKATNESGTMKIEAVEKYKRAYSWSGKEKTFKLSPRRERWFGSKGAYCPSGDREMHVVLEEGQQHFSSQEEVYPWMCWESYNGERNVQYTSDGLVVIWREQQHPTEANYSALSVDVWQIYVNGQKPVGLRGASDRSIKVLQPGATEIIIGKPLINTAKNINGRNYYGKALDFMDECKISSDLVEKVISKAIPTYEGEFMHYSGWGLKDDALSFSVWVNSSGDVVFVFGMGKGSP
jgi:hypothetical protein